MFKPVQKLLFTSLLLSTAFVVQAAPESEATATDESESTTLATDSENMFREKFMKLDINNDGFIDSEEANMDKELSGSFKKLAKNGKLDQPGYESWELESKKVPKG